MGVGIEAAGGIAAESAHGSGPDVVCFFVDGDGQDGAVGEAVGHVKGLPFAVFVQGEAVVGTGPDAIAVDGDGIDAIVGQAVGGGEVLPLKARHGLREGGQRQQG